MDKVQLCQSQMKCWKSNHLALLTMAMLRSLRQGWGILSPVCGSLNYSQPNHTCLTTIQNKMQGSDNWWSSKMWHMQKNQSFVLPLATFITSNLGRENCHGCLEEAFNQLVIHNMESWSSNETAGNTGVSLQGLAKKVWTCLWLVNENLIWNYGMFVQLKFCGGFINLFLSWEQACKKEVALQHQHLRQIYLYFCSGIPQKQW